MLASKSVELAEVLKAMEEITDDEELWYQYLAREKALRDEISRINYASAKGIEEGIEKGRKEGIAIGEKRGEKRGISIGEKRGKQKTALNLLQQGVDIAIISNATGLSEDEILKLK